MSDISLEVPVTVAGYYKVVLTDRETGVSRTAMEFERNRISDLGLNELQENFYNRSTLYLIPSPVVEGSSVGQNLMYEDFPERAPSSQIYPPYPYNQVYPAYPLPYPGTGLPAVNMVGAKGITYQYAYSSYCSPTGVEPFFGANTRTFRDDSGDSYTFASIGLGGTIRETRPFGPDGLGHPNGGYNWWYFFSNVNVKDSSGSLTTITKSSNDILDVYYQLRCYAPTGDTISEFEYEGVTYQARIRPANKTSDNMDWRLTGTPGTFSIAFFSPSGIAGETSNPPNNGSSSMGLASPYVRNSLTVRGSTYVALDAVNFPSGIRSMWFQSFGTLGDYQIEFTPSIPKNRYKAIRFTVGLKWSRHNGPS